jgi:hypothetical protein
MPRTALPVALALALHAAPALGSPGPADALTDEEKAGCARELDAVEKRRRIFEAQRLPEAEIARKNEAALAAVRECRDRVRAEAARAAEQDEMLAEVERRLGPSATEVEREKAWREVRRERLAAKPARLLTAEEKAELRAGLGEELRATHATRDEANAADPAFMRQVNSALACFHGVRKARLANALDHEESLVKLGTGDRQKVYALRSGLKQSEEIHARATEAGKRAPGGLIPCADQRTAVLAHCLAIRFEGRKAEPACDAEDIQQYLRFLR